MNKQGNYGQPNFDDEIDISQIYSVIRKYTLAALIAGAMLGSTTYLVSSHQAKVFRAEAKIVVSLDDTTRNNLYYEAEPPSLDLLAYKEVALSPSILEKTLGRSLDPSDLAKAKKKFSVVTKEGRHSGLLFLRVDANTPGAAARIANSWAKALLDWEKARALGNIAAQKKSLSAQINAISEQLSTMPPDDEEYLALQLLKAQLQQKYSQVEVLEAGIRPRLQLLEPAHVPAGSIRPKPLLNSVLALTFAFFLVFFGALVKELASPYVRNPEDAALLTGMPVLAEFPRLPVRKHIDLPIEVANYLRVSLKPALLRDDPASVLVTSSVEGEGKTSVSIALAKSLAQEGRPTLLVDADLRSPNIAAWFGLQPKHGLLHALTNLEEVAVEAEPNLHVLPCVQTPKDPIEVLQRSFKEWMKFTANIGRYRYVILDGAPLLAVADSLTIAPFSTSTIMVVAESTTTKKQLERSVQLLNGIGVQPYGLVVNRVQQPSVVFFGGYGKKQYGYGVPRVKRPVLTSDHPGSRGQQKSS